MGATRFPDERLELMPDEPEAHGLLAMMLLHDARRGARFRDGDPVLLADQDRLLWDAAQIAALYGELSRLTDSPVVELNRAVAVAEAEGPEAGLEIADRLPLDEYHYLHSTRAERRLLERRLAEL